MRGPVEVIRGNGMTGCNQRTVGSREGESMIGATNELAERLAAEGASVAITGRKASEVDAAAASIGPSGVRDQS